MQNAIILNNTTYVTVDLASQIANQLYIAFVVGVGIGLLIDEFKLWIIDRE